MEHIGIDLHKISSRVCILSDDGQLTERRIKSTRYSFDEVFADRPRVFAPEDKTGRLKLVASPDGREGSLKIHQNVSVYNAILKIGDEVSYQLAGDVQRAAAAGRHMQRSLRLYEPGIYRGHHELDGGRRRAGGQCLPPDNQVDR